MSEKLPRTGADDLAARIVTSDLFRALGPKVFPAMHRFMAKASKGRFVPGAGLVLYSKGAKSGVERESPLETIPRGDGTYLIVGSNFAQESHPAWTYNLLTHPDVEILRKGKRRQATAHLLEGAERADAWDEALRHWPAWEQYGTITDRSFRIFHLIPK